MQLTDYEGKSLQKLGEAIYSGRWSNVALIQLIELAGDLLNIKTISNYAKHNKMSYKGASKESSIRKTTMLFKTKYIIDNQ